MVKQPLVREINWEAATRAVKDVAAAQNVPTTVFPKTGEPGKVGPSEIDPGAPVEAPYPASATKQSRQRIPSASPTKMFSCILPIYLIEEIQSRSFHSRPKQTTNYTVLMAFKEAGYHVSQDDLVPDRRRSRSKV